MDVDPGLKSNHTCVYTRVLRHVLAVEAQALLRARGLMEELPPVDDKEILL